MALFQQQILDKIKKINDRFDDISKDESALTENEGADHLELGEEEDGEWGEQDAPQRPPTSSTVGDSRVFGRGVDKNKVVDMLLSSQQQQHGSDGSRGADEDVSVVSVVGMGGIGKTTLAQLVFDDEKVKSHFKLRAWVYVSDWFDVVRLTREILEAVTKRKTGLQGFSPLQEALRNHLREQGRFLLVLDDLWNEEWRHWESLWKPLSTGAQGSRVLVTTRNQEVSKVSGTIRTHRLDFLPSGDAWSLFAHCAFGRENPDCPPNLRSIGERIVRKCGGLPLAIRALGVALFDETDEDKWSAILNSEVWELPEEESGILPALKLSYRHLPPPIKPCFAVCVVFPRDYLFTREDLVFLWMAQGYLARGSRRKPMEDVGREYVDDLLQRSFLQMDPSDRDLHGVEVFKMHDLVRALAMSIGGGNECFTVEAAGKLPSSPAMVRHLSYSGDSHADFVSLVRRSKSKFPHARSSYLMKEFNPEEDPLFPVFVLDDMCKRMKCLRVLDLHALLITVLPPSIGDLKHLRCLTICGVRLSPVRLPETLGNLLNLQTLKVYIYGGTLRLPSSIRNLVNLRHLRVDRPVSLPRDIGRLTQLRTIASLIVGRGADAAGIEELRHMDQLQGELKLDVRSLGSCSNTVNREPGILSNKAGLKVLILKLDYFKGTTTTTTRAGGGGGGSSSAEQQEELLELIRPHTNIKELHLSSYLGARVPEWMGDPSYSRLERIVLSELLHPLAIGSIGRLPSLKYLRVQYYSNTGIDLSAVDRESRLVRGAGAPSEPFPSLRELEISRCENLRQVTLPQLTALRKLRIEDCIYLSTLGYCCDNPDRRHRQYPQQEQQGDATPVVHHHVHLPRVHTMVLKDCGMLMFPPASACGQLPPSLRRFDFRGSDWVGGWVERHIRRTRGVANLLPEYAPRYDRQNMSASPVFYQRTHLVLRNMEDEEEAKAAALIPFLFPVAKVEIRWDHDDQQQQLRRSSSSEAAHERILQALAHRGESTEEQPLDELVIKGYQGRSFPGWVSLPGTFPYLSKMTLAGCIHCERLPPLGQLRCLEELHISNMPKVVHVGREFYIHHEGGEGGHDVLMPFPGLRVLTIRNFPRLRTFRLPGRDALSSPRVPSTPSSSSSSGSSSGAGAGGSTVSPVLISPPPLDMLLIEDCPQLASVAGVNEMPSLRGLLLRGCPAVGLSHELVRLPPNLEYVEITGCPRLSEWCRSGNRISHLRGLWVDGELVFSDVDAKPEEIFEMAATCVEEDTDETSSEEDTDEMWGIEEDMEEIIMDEEYWPDSFLG